MVFGLQSAVFSWQSSVGSLQSVVFSWQSSVSISEQLTTDTRTTDFISPVLSLQVHCYPDPIAGLWSFFDLCKCN